MDSSRAIHRLGWRPCWRVDGALRTTAEWYRAAAAAPAGPGAMRASSLAQIAAYAAAARGAGIGWAA